MAIAIPSAAISDTLVDALSPTSELSTLPGDEEPAKAVIGGAGPSKSTSRGQGKQGKEGDKATYCHHCHRKVDPAAVSRCSNIKQIGKHSRKCGRAYCHKDLTNRYGYTQGQMPQGEWKCPCCDGVCMDSGCRKKRESGIPPALASASTSTSTPAKAPRASVPTPKKTTLPKSSSKANGSATPHPVTTFPALGTSQAHNKLSKLAKSDKSLKRDSSGFELDAPHPVVVYDSDESALTDLEAEGNDGGVGKRKSGPKAHDKRKEEDGPKSKKARLSVVIPSKRKEKKDAGGGAGKENEQGKEKDGKPKKGKPSAASAAGTEKGKGTPKGKGKKAEQVSTPSKSKGKGKEKESKAEGTPGAKATPKPKPKAPPVPRPKFEQIATELSQGDVEYRIQLREYLYRFHEVLSIPGRLLPAVDDFDRPLTEASVKLFAGAMLDVFKDEFPDDDEDDDVVELHNKLFKYREELRFYGDLARFSQIYTDLSSSALELVLPPPAPSNSPYANSTDLGTRRNASRLPSPDEVIRMLVSMAERTLESPIIHDELDGNNGEAAAQRENAKEVKAENTRWEAEKKKLGAGQLKAKNAADGKKAAMEIKEGTKDHQLRLSTLEVNLRATMARRAVRYAGPVGTDHEGRLYYLLTPRIVEDYGRPPMGWASGLVCWGIGGGASGPSGADQTGIKAKQVNGKAKGKTNGHDDQGGDNKKKGQEEGEEEEEEEDDLPPAVERWSHFGASAHIAHLVRWLADNKCERDLVQRIKEAQEWVEVLEYKGQGEE